MERDQLFLILAWIVFYTLHSLFASDWLKMRVPFTPLNYRRFYTIIALLTFAGVLYLSIIVSSWDVLERRSWMKPLGLILAVWGVWIINLSFRYYSFRQFVGLKTGEMTLHKTGLMKLVRHPLYVGTLLILIGYFLFSPTNVSLIILIISVIYVFIGIYLEELKLIREFGEEYIRYKKEVPMLIPFLRF
jgi:protein-S-isoprenylcysteine O-methyltransferase Ste14